MRGLYSGSCGVAELDSGFHSEAGLGEVLWCWQNPGESKGAAGSGIPGLEQFHALGHYIYIPKQPNDQRT